MRTFFYLAVVASCSTYLTAQQVVRGPYLQVLTSNSIEIAWSTDVPTDSRVIFGTALNSQVQEVADAQMKTDHFVTISGLMSSTEYYYSIGNSTSIMAGNQPSFRFKTAPENGDVGAYRFWVIGDFGKGNQGQKDVRDSFVQFQGNSETGAMIWLGDNAYADGTQLEYQEKVFDIYDSILTYIPVFSTPGNHDYNSVNRFDPPLQHVGPYYDIINSPIHGEAGGVASGTELYYSFDYGNIHFISLNSEIQAWTTSSNSQMFQWLEQDLSANTKEWVICYFHQPPYSKGSHNSDDVWELFMAAMRQNALPILEQHGVDLVLCGHSHVYERSKLIKGHYGYSFTYNNATQAISSASGNFNDGQHYVKYLNGSNAGTVYVVCGNSGSKTDNSSLNHPVMVANDGGANAYGSLVIDVNGNRLDCKYLKSNGVVHDEFTIVKPDGSAPIHASTYEISQLSNVKLYPNPTKDEVTLAFDLINESNVWIVVSDAVGKEISRFEYKAKVGSNTTSFRVDQLSVGSYFVQLNTNSACYSFSFMKKD